MSVDLQLEKLCKAYGERSVLNQLSFHFSPGKPNCILGPSGCGKTTLLRLICGLEAPDSGHISGVEGKKISAVFQEDRLFQQLSAEKNVLLTASGHIERNYARSLLRQLGLDEGDMQRPVREFSGGMARRVAIARALAAEYDLLVLDEPLRGLDGETRQRALDCIRTHAEGRTSLWVTHDERDAQQLQARILRLAPLSTGAVPSEDFPISSSER